MLIISYIATFLGTNSLSVLLCHKAVNQLKPISMASVVWVSAQLQSRMNWILRTLATSDCAVKPAATQIRQIAKFSSMHVSSTRFQTPRWWWSWISLNPSCMYGISAFTLMQISRCGLRRCDLSLPFYPPVGKTVVGSKCCGTTSLWFMQVWPRVMTCIGCVFGSVSRFGLQYWYSVVSTDSRHRTSLMNFNMRLTLSHGIDYGSCIAQYYALNNYWLRLSCCCCSCMEQPSTAGDVITIANNLLAVLKKRTVY